jgi:hypothetical protein
MRGAYAQGGGGAVGRYYVARNGQQFGPYTMEELQRYLGEGRLSLTDLAWTEGMQAWVALAQLPDLGQYAARTRPMAVAPVAAGYGHPVYQPQSMVKPSSYMVPAVLATLFCCVPFGIVSIVFASQVDSKFHAGDYRGAVEASNKARGWFIAALICGLIAGAIYLLAIVVNAGSR